LQKLEEMAKKLGTDLEKGIKSDSMASRQEHFGYTYVAPPPPESIFGAPPLELPRTRLGEVTLSYSR
jgi:hypothetical protein